MDLRMRAPLAVFIAGCVLIGPLVADVNREPIGDSVLSARPARDEDQHEIDPHPAHNRYSTSGIHVPVSRPIVRPGLQSVASWRPRRHLGVSMTHRFL